MSLKGGGHGTIISGSTAQGNARAYVTDSGQAESYESNTTLDVVNDTGNTVAEGQVVLLNYTTALNATSIGTRGTGSVSDDGNTLTVTDAGDTGLSGTVNISNDYGNNQGWGGTRLVRFANVNGEAAYLGEE